MAMNDAALNEAGPNDAAVDDTGSNDTGLDHTASTARTVRGHALPCGRAVQDVWEDLEAGRVTPHEASCEHCTTARRGLAQLAEATRSLLADPAEPPPGMLDRIMAAVRADVRRAETLPLPSELGPAEISEPAVAAVLRYAADGVPGVRARSCRIELAGDPGAVRVRMSLALRYGTESAATVFGRVRARVGAAISGQIGFTAAAIDLELVDVWHGESR